MPEHEAAGAAVAKYTIDGSVDAYVINLCEHLMYIAKF